MVNMLISFNFFSIYLAMKEELTVTSKLLLNQENSPSNPPHKLSTYSIKGNSCLSNILFSWSFGLIRQSQNKELTTNDMPSLRDGSKIKDQYSAFQEKWDQIKSTGQKNKFINVVLSTKKKQIAKLLLLTAVVYIFYLSYPVLIYFDIEYVNSLQKDLKVGVMLFVLTTVGLLLYSMVIVHQKYKQSQFGINLVNITNMMIFQKSLKYPIISNKQFKQADIINYCQIDADNLKHLAQRLIFFTFGVIEIIVGLLLLYVFIGILFLIPLVTMVVINLISFCIGQKTINYDMKILQKKDDRMNATQQMLSIIKYIKINALQKHFYCKINNIRNLELLYMRKKGILQSCMNLLYYLTAPVILSTIFLTQFYLENQITAAKVFATVTIIHIFQFTAHALPRSISEIISVFNSIKRIEEFLLAKEIEEKNYQVANQKQGDVNAIIIQKGNFYSQPILPSQIENQQQTLFSKNNIQIQKLEQKRLVFLIRNINLKIQKNKFYMIFGDIGSGKSSLLVSILNQMMKGDDTVVKINGSVAYVPQRPWVMCESLQNNVTFASEKDEARLQRALRGACLVEDIRILPDGVKTAIGENGINLSGGQKTRVGLGRALYSESDIYLFDDVLSAVDVHVAEYILREAIGTMLKGKTVIMATHATKFAHFADRIILMNAGNIVAEGDHKIISKMKEFSMIKAHIKQNEQKAQDKQLIEQFDKEKIANNFPQSEISLIKQESNINQLIVEEESLIGNLRLQIFLKYIQHNGGYIWFSILIIGTFIVYGTLQTLGAIFIQEWSQSEGTDKKSLVLYVICTISSIFFISLEVYMMTLANIKQGRQVHSTIIKRLLYSSYTQFFNRVPMGRILNRIGKDLKDLDEVIGTSLSYCLLYAIQFVSGLIVVIYCSSIYVLIPTIVVFVLFYLIRKYYVSALHKVIRLQKISNSPVVSGFTTAVSGLTTIRAFKKKGFFINRQADLLDQNTKMSLNRYGLDAWFELALNAFIFILNFFSIGLGMFSDSSTSSSFGLLLISMMSVNELIYYLILQYTSLEANMICLQRLYEFMGLPVEGAYSKYVEEWKSSEEVLPEVIQRGEVEFRGASVRYREDLPNIVNGFSVRIDAGEKVGIVGRTGSGKSTIINALLRTTELSEGQIFIDGV